MLVQLPGMDFKLWTDDFKLVFIFQEEYLLYIQKTIMLKKAGKIKNCWKTQYSYNSRREPFKNDKI
jgi:hypothetical protein